MKALLLWLLVLVGSSTTYGYNKISNSESNDQYGDIGDTEYLSADELLSDILLPPAHNPLATTISCEPYCKTSFVLGFPVHTFINCNKFRGLSKRHCVCCHNRLCLYPNLYSYPN